MLDARLRLKMVLISTSMTFLMVLINMKENVRIVGACDIMQLWPQFPAQCDLVIKSETISALTCDHSSQLEIQQRDQERLVRSNDQSPVTLFSRQVVLGVGGRHDVGGVNHGDLKKEGASCLQIQTERKEIRDQVTLEEMTKSWCYMLYNMLKILKNI